MTLDLANPEQLASALQQMHQRINELAAANDVLTEQNQTLAAHMKSHQEVPATEIPVKEPKITLPEKFDGSRAKFRGFINQLKLTFQMAPSRYATDQVKIATLGSLLTGDALSWFNPFIEHPESHEGSLSSWESFNLALSSAFADSDMASAAEAKIRTLRQGRSPAVAYASKFKQTAADLSWNDVAFISQFKSGLSEDVKDMLVYQDPLPTTLEDFINLAIRLDNRIYERSRDTRAKEDRLNPSFQKTSNYNPGASANPSASSGPMAMDIDLVRTRREPLSPEERARRFDNQLCMFCGAAGHFKASCPIKPKRKVSSLTTKTSHDDTEDQDFQ
jgi:hypothetical protein